MKPSSENNAAIQLKSLPRDVPSTHMELVRLEARRYRSLREVELDLGALNVLIGVNASGKSTVLDALRLLSEGNRVGDFGFISAWRGGFASLAWKGDVASVIELKIVVRSNEEEIAWSVQFSQTPREEVEVAERVEILGANGSPATELLQATGGRGRWWSTDGTTGRWIQLALPNKRGCALTAASTDASFKGRSISEFVRRWGFFDPAPVHLGWTSYGENHTQLVYSGLNLAGHLRWLKEQSPDKFEQILRATRAIVGLPDTMEFRISEDQHVSFALREPGLDYQVQQIAASSGTLRMLSLMVALFGGDDHGLVGIEEPENHIHPAALQAFAEYLREASKHKQVLVATHSPLLLDCLDTPEAICLVRRTNEGTVVTREDRPDAVRSALVESGLRLGEFHETKGFGG